jgi:hypothetical protein
MAVARTRPIGVFVAVALLLVSMLVSGVALADNGGSGGNPELPWHAVHFVCSLVVGVYTWVSASQKASDREVQEMRTRLATMEERMRHTPTEAEGRTVIVAMAAQQTKLEALIEKLESMSNRFERYEEHMLARNA